MGSLSDVSDAEEFQEKLSGVSLSALVALIHLYDVADSLISRQLFPGPWRP
jgi:hypothetical protein